MEQDVKVHVYKVFEWLVCKSTLPTQTNQRENPQWNFWKVHQGDKTLKVWWICKRGAVKTAQRKSTSNEK